MEMAFYEKENDCLIHRRYPIEWKEFPCLELSIEKLPNNEWKLYCNYWFKEKRFDGENWTDKWWKSLIQGFKTFSRLKDAKLYWEVYDKWFELWFILWTNRNEIEIQ